MTQLTDYLDLLNFAADEFVAVFYKRHDEKHTAVLRQSNVAAFVSVLSYDFDIYLAPNAVAGPERYDQGRGKETDVTRVTAVYADLDIKPGACPDFQAAIDLTKEVSGFIGMRPVATIFSGGGIQPLWRLEDCPPDVGRKLLRRFGRLVKIVAAARNIKVDSVFDTARVLRVPETLNHKYDPPKASALIVGDGGPLSPEELDERLNEAGVYDLGEDEALNAEVVKYPEDCKWAAETCSYMRKVIDEYWPSEDVSDRHPWLLCQFVRLECARRYICLTEKDYRRGVDVLIKRFESLCARPGDTRSVKRLEIKDICEEAHSRASRKTDEQIGAELGSRLGGAHSHPLPFDDIPAIGGPENGTEANTEPDAHTLAVLRKAYELRILDEGRALWARQRASLTGQEPAELINLTDMLAVPDPVINYRIDRLLPTGGRALLAAQYKAGKTSMVGNLIHALADGGKFLNCFTADPVSRIVLIDTELDPNMLRRWLRDQGIENRDHIDVLALRGRMMSFNIVDQTTRAEWARKLKGASVIVLDCLRPCLDAFGLSEDREAGIFLTAFDALCHESGANEAVVVHHMGHGQERSRGDSRLLDWPDALWKIVRDEETGERFFSAVGRDVNVPETALNWSAENRVLTTGEGNRADRKANAAVADIIDIMASVNGNGISKNQLVGKLKSYGVGRNVARAAVELAVADNVLLTVEGPRNSVLHTLHPLAGRT